MTYLSGNEKRQRKHAMADAWQTLNVAKANELSAALSEPTRRATPSIERPTHD
ncbi:hypothetical protein [Sphingomonas sp. BE137]|uniref:hypothetical protein n=1 Tax=Sphingomonas sp. BE137 TaxID=2817844 RepID=UPI001AE2DE55|nr:hypothetical protein [Sphingomonas sp. BE137]MDR6847144.1 hypothetical protein [Sphingomonas sp. BE137]